MYTQDRFAALAIPADPAVMGQGDNHPIADLHGSTRSADRLDDSAALMTEHDRELVVASAEVPGGPGDVGVTQSGRRDPDQNLVVGQRREDDVAELGA